MQGNSMVVIERSDELDAGILIEVDACQIAGGVGVVDVEDAGIKREAARSGKAIRLGRRC